MREVQYLLDTIASSVVVCVLAHAPAALAIIHLSRHFGSRHMINDIVGNSVSTSKQVRQLASYSTGKEQQRDI